MTAKQLPGVYSPDGSLYITLTDGEGNLVDASGGGGGTPGGSDTQVQYNSAGAFAGITGATSDGTALTLVAPVLGTPASGTLTNCIGLPISTGVSGLGTGVATFLATPSSANLASAITNETGTGSLVFANTPTLVTPVLGVATATTLAIGGATIGTNALAVTGTSAFGGDVVANGGNGINFNTQVKIVGVPTEGIALIGSGSGNQARLFIDAANTLAQRNGTNAQKLNVYNTFTDASNYERLSLFYNSNLAILRTEAAGTGSRRDLYLDGATLTFQTGSIPNIRWIIDASGKLASNSLTLSDQANVFAITATQPSSPTGTQNAITETITGAGSASQANYAHVITYAAGYTGSSFNAGLKVLNSNVGTLSSGLYVGLAGATANPSVSAALIADNGSQSQPIFLARDNGTTVVTIGDGGLLTTTNGINNTGGSVNSPTFYIPSVATLTTGGSDGTILLRNNTGNNFDRLMFGGTTSSFPALKRSTTTLRARLADDSAFTNIQGKLTTDANAVTETVVPDSTITLYDASGTAYKVPCVAA